MSTAPSPGIASPGMPLETPSTLRVAGVSKAFHAIHALTDVTLEFPAGQITALLGENGAGKTTLVSIIAGGLRPDSGALSVGGKPLTFSSPLDAMQHGVFVVLQEPQLVNEMTVAQNLFLYELGEQPPWRGYNPGRAVKQAIIELERLGLIELLDPALRVSQLSAAGRQLVGIARALIRKAQVLLLDEPNSSLTPKETERLLGLLRHLRRQGVAIGFVSHRLREVYELADRVVVLRDGKKVLEGSCSEVPVERAIDAMAGDHTRTPAAATPSSGAIAPYREEGAAAQPGREVLRLDGCSGQRFTDVSFAIRSGEIVGFAGLVGSGRTEIAKAVIGIDPLLAGQVWLAGKPVRIKNPRRAIASGVVYLGEERRTQVFYGQSIRFNMTVSALDGLTRWGMVSRRKQAAVAAEYFSALAVKAPTANAAVTSLSGGNQQKLLFARLLATGPDVLILDEPTRGVDVNTRREIHEILRRLAAEGKAIWLISSDLDDIIQVADRVLIVRQGRIVDSLEGGATARALVAAAIGEEVTSMRALSDTRDPGGSA